MTVLSPCRRCARKGDCERLADLRKSLRGAGITKANVRCGIPKADFPVGQPVVVRCFTLDYGEFADSGYRRVNVARHGVVRSHRAGKFRVLLNVGEEVGAPGEDDMPISIVTAYHDQLALVEEQEAPVKLCDCGLTEDRCGELAYRPHLRSGPWQCWSERIA